VLFIVRQILGPALAHESQPDLITYTRHGRNARTEHSIWGRRLVTIAETSSRMQIEEGQLKRLTGEPEISIDEHYARDRITVPVTFTMASATNDMPVVPAMDGAVAERMTVIPCGPTIPEADRDPHLAERILDEEREAVFATLVDRASRYYAEGLPKPKAVAAATAAFCAGEEDAPGFARACLGVVWGGDCWIDMAEAYRVYRAWASHGGREGLTSRQFIAQMEAIPGILKVDNGGSVRRYVGCTWNQDSRNTYRAGIGAG
jgi:phage/plasmid-associated DNA primase